MVNVKNHIWRTKNTFIKIKNYIDQQEIFGATLFPIIKFLNLIKLVQNFFVDGEGFNSISVCTAIDPVVKFVSLSRFSRVIDEIRYIFVTFFFSWPINTLRKNNAQVDFLSARFLDML